MFETKSTIPLLAIAFIMAGTLCATAFAETYRVSTTLDSGGTNCAVPGSRCILRDAINTANARIGADQIVFDVSGTFVPLTPMPDITDLVTIDGTTAPGYVAGGPPVLSLDGTLAGANADGFRFINDSVVSNLTAFSIVGFDGDGVSITQGATSIQIEACYIGLRPDGTPLGNGRGILAATSFNIIGSELQPNVIAANNGNGISVVGNANLIRHNHIGRVSSPPAPGNTGNGINIAGNINTIGSFRNVDQDASNSVMGNGGDGIFVLGSDNVIIGNDIGDDGANANSGSGVALSGARNRVGGTNLQEQNLIHNNNVGIQVGDTLSATDSRVEMNVISGSDMSGIVIGAGSLNRIEGNHIFQNGDTTVSPGIWILSDENFINGNLIGVEPVASPGNSGAGIRLSGNRNTIGVSAIGLSDGNVIGRNQRSGIEMLGDFSVIRNNFIGTDMSGSFLGNQPDGIAIIGSVTGSAAEPIVISDNVIGHSSLAGIRATNGALLSHARLCGNHIGLSPDGVEIRNGTEGVVIDANSVNIGSAGICDSNVISFNGSDGIILQGTNNVISGNQIGTDRSLSMIAGNGISGIWVRGSTSSGNIIELNNIAFNASTGIDITSGPGTSNLMFRNLFEGNQGIGIDLGGDGITDNDPGDADTGPNLLQNFPILGNIDINGDLISLDVRIDSDTANTVYPIEVRIYIADAIGSRQGMIFLTGITVEEADANLNIRITDIPLGGISSGSLTATASSGLNTSEFSLPVTFGLPDELYADGFE